MELICKKRDEEGEEKGTRSGLERELWGLLNL